MSIRYGNENPTIKYNAYDPKSYLIIGDTSKMDNEKLESFELFRNSLKDIEIITFDELIQKLELIVEIYLNKLNSHFSLLKDMFKRLY